LEVVIAVIGAAVLGARRRRETVPGWIALVVGLTCSSWRR